jgi:hypothetical protein
MKEENCAAIGWRNIRDLSGLADDSNTKDKIREQLEAEGEISADPQARPESPFWF